MGIAQLVGRGRARGLDEHPDGNWEAPAGQVDRRGEWLTAAEAGEDVALGGGAGQQVAAARDEHEARRADAAGHLDLDLEALLAQAGPAHGVAEVGLHGLAGGRARALRQATAPAPPPPRAPAGP